MKKIINGISYLFFAVIFITIALTIFVGSSQRVIEWTAQKYAPEYDFSYTHISGTLFSGIEVKDLAFKDEKLMDTIGFAWSPLALLSNTITINKLELLGVEVDALKNTAKAFASDEPKSEDNSSFVMPMALEVNNIDISINSFEEENITINSITLKSKNILFQERLDIERLLLNIDTNISTLAIDATLQDQKATLSKLSLEEVDLVQIRQIIDSLQSQEDSNSSTAVAEKKSTPSPLMPTALEVESLKIAINPAKFPEVDIVKASLDIESITVDMLKVLTPTKNAIEVEKIVLVADTNLTTISLDASLKNEKVLIEELFIEEIDTLALEKLFVPKESNSTDINNTESNSTQVEASEPSPFVPKSLELKKFHTSIKQALYDDIDIKSLQIDAKEFIFDIHNLIAKDGAIDINAISNLATLEYSISIIDNQIKSKGVATPLKELFTKYTLREGGIEPIAFVVDANQSHVDAKIAINGTKILVAKEGEFNVEKLAFVNRLHYNIPDKKLTLHNKANIQTPYAKDILLDNNVVLDGEKFHFKGSLLPGKLEALDANQSKPLQDLTISYEGNNSSIEAYIDSAELQGQLISSDFKQGDFNLSTKKPLVLQELVTLPPKLEKTKLEFDINAPLDFVNKSSNSATVKILSNLVNFDATIDYNKSVKVQSTTSFPANSLLRDFDKALHLDKINPLKSDIQMDDKSIEVDIVSNAVNAKAMYNLENQDIRGMLDVVKERIVFAGNLQNKVILKHAIPNIKELVARVQTLYSFEDPKIDGDVNLSISIENKSKLDLTIASNQLRVKPDKKTEHIIDDTMFSLEVVDTNLTLKSYHTTFQEQKIFATKPSFITFEKSIISIAPFWLNDSLQITGNYNLSNKKGDILAYADTFVVSHKMIDLKSKINVKAIVDGIKTKVDGKVTIMGGRVYLDMDKRSFATDSDIILVQNIKKREASPFMENLMLSLIIDTQKPLVYKNDDADIKLKTDVVVQQIGATPLAVYGTATIVDGSYYMFQEKKFTLKDSLIAFIGDPSKPILDIMALYNSINYEIKIQVTGDPQTPNLIFSSIPTLTREQILSVILFDNEDAGDSSSGDDMMKMMGGAMAKSALSGVGIKIDHLSLGTDGSMEVGKKISDKVTIIYSNDEVSSARLQYDWNKNIKSNIMSDGESSGVDIIYRREF